MTELVCLLISGSKVAKAQQDRDDALQELFDAMSDALGHCDRFDLVATHKSDRDLISKIALKTQECAVFISEYAEQTNFGAMFFMWRQLFIVTS